MMAFYFISFCVILFFNDILIVSGYLAFNYHDATIEGESGYRFTDRRLGVRLLIID